MFRKVIARGATAQKKFLEGVNTVDDMIGSTLGPAGTNKVIQRKYKAPMITNDGATIARHIVLDDPIEDMAAQTIIEISMQTAEQAGDGTTTSVVMASELTRTGYDLLEKGSKKTFLEGGEKEVTAMQLWRQINDEKTKAVEHLKEMAEDLTDERLKDVIATSLENLEYGEQLGELFQKIGKDGYIAVEENWATKKGIDTEVVQGMRFLGKYATPYLAMSANKKEAIWEDTHILVTNQKIEHVHQIEKLGTELLKSGKRKLVIIGGYSEGESGFSKEFIAQIASVMKLWAESDEVKRSGILQVLAVKAPTLTSQELEDVAVFCDAKFFDTALKLDVKDASLEDTGFARKVSVTEDEVNVLGGRGNVQERIAVLKQQAELEKDEMFKQKMLKRIASLASGVGIIRVGASTETERSYLKYKLEDAVLAIKAAWEEGVVPGGGRAYAQLAEHLGTDSILYRMLMAPQERIKKNLGVSELEIEDTVIDPVKVVRIAIQNACSGAGMLITSDGAVAEVKLNFMDYLEKAMKKALMTDNDDFRASENQDQGAGRFID